MMQEKWVIAWCRQLVGDNGNKFLSLWPSFATGTYSSYEEAVRDLKEKGNRREEKDGLVYFGGVMRREEALR